jgi:hypothetical protein
MRLFVTVFLYIGAAINLSRVMAVDVIETLICTGSTIAGTGSCTGKDLTKFGGNLVCQDENSCFELAIGSATVQPKNITCSAFGSCSVSALFGALHVCLVFSVFI